MTDPHAEIHELAAQDAHDDGEAVGSDEQTATPEERLVNLDQRLTKRINDLRKDFDTTRKAVSKSVGDFQQQVTDLKTEAENNKALIESLRGAVELAESNAKKAGHTADEAHQLATHNAETLKSTVAEFDRRANQLEDAITSFRTDYENHTHDVTITMQGETNPPKPHGGAA